MQWGFYIDQTRCTGCFACVVACKDVNDVGAGAASWRKIVAVEKGTFPEVFMSFLPVSCWHCSRVVEPTDSANGKTVDETMAFKL